MWSNLFKAALKTVAKVAKNPKTWKAIGSTVGPIALSYGKDKLLAKKELTTRQKLKELTKMLDNHEISKEEYETIRKTILGEYR